MGLWSLFNAGREDIYSPHWHRIKDNNGHWLIDEDYANLGVSEGWLELDSYKYWDGVMGNVYRHKP